MSDWTDDAACRDADPDWWHPVGTTDDDYAPALAVCRTCPVASQCLERAMAIETSRGDGARHGVWGGLTPHERYRLYANRTRASRKEPK